MTQEIEDQNNDEIEYKLILLGDTSVGKTCLFKKITTGVFMDKNVSTVGIDRRTIDLKCEFDENGKKVEKNISISLTDTAGQERFKAITRSYYKGSDAAILIYDITDKKTFNHVKEWIESIQNSLGNLNNNNYIIFLMGTKIDLVESQKKARQVGEEEAKNKCKEFKIEWGGECSNKTFSEEKFKEIFKEYVQIIYKKIGFRKVVKQQTVNLGIIDKKPRKGECPCNIF
jgi:small GTP-binding protein